jgi:hypothetical protein
MFHDQRPGKVTWCLGSRQLTPASVAFVERVVKADAVLHYGARARGWATVPAVRVSRRDMSRRRDQAPTRMIDSRRSCTPIRGFVFTSPFAHDAVDALGR